MKSTGRCDAVAKGAALISTGLGAIVVLIGTLVKRIGKANKCNIRYVSTIERRKRIFTNFKS